MSEQGSQSFERRNVGSGLSVVNVATLADDSEYVLVVLLGSHYCPRSRELVKGLVDSDVAFHDRSVTVVPVLPDTTERASVWAAQYDLPFPFLADPDENFGAVCAVGDEWSARPSVVLLAQGDGSVPRVVDEWSVTAETPTVEAVLRRLDESLETKSGAAGGT